MLLALPLSAAGFQAHSQEAERWNDPRVLELLDRARVVRSSAVVDSSFRAYSAEARGYVYFFIDRPDSDERTLVKADQIALEIYWRAPNQTGQRIVGLRDRKLLPTNIRYHLDHLTVVQDDFGDRIRLGDGDEVSAVIHPVAPGAADVYDYRLADSLSIRYGGGEDEVRVYEVRVRPRDPDRPGFIGSVYLDRANAAIVRMSFTFTPASYVDGYLDYIRISLDNSLWEGRHWLPYRQEVELRRELPQLDFLAGSVIRGRFEIGSYEFNPPLEDAPFNVRGVTAASPADRAAFPFEEGLFDDLEREGLAPPPSLEEIRSRAREIVADRALSGLGPLRLHVPSVSDVARYDRAEGFFVGAGLNLRPIAGTLARVSGGYAFGREKPSFLVSFAGESEAIVPVLEARWDALRDIGPIPATVPVLSSFGAALLDEDYLDPYFVRGARVTLRGPRPGEGWSASLSLERHESARLVVAGDFRPVRAVDEGTLGALELSAPLPLPAGGEGRTTGMVGRLGSSGFATLRGSALWRIGSRGAGWSGVAAADAGVGTVETPAQARFLLGGPGTLPGHGVRAFEGRAFWLARAEATHPLAVPWLGVRLTGSVGATHLADADRLPDAWSGLTSDGVRASVGVGLSFGWDVLRLDLARGLPDGGWALVFSVEPRFHPFL